MNNLEFVYKYSDSFSNPVDICVSSPDKFVFVTDAGNKRVCRLNYNGLEVLNYSKRYGRDLQYSWDSPAGICYNDGYLYVVDKGNHVLVVLNYRTLSYVNHFGTIGKSGSSTALLNTPRGVCSDGYYIYIADTANSRIMKLDRYLNYKAQTTIELNSPIGIAYNDYEDNIIVVNHGSDKIIKLSKSLDEKIDTIGSSGSGEGEFSSPLYVAVDEYNIYVTDSCNHRIQVFDLSTMDYVAKSGSLGSGDDQFSYPSGICYYRSMLFITDQNNRIKVITNYLKSRLRKPEDIILLDDPNARLIGDELIVGADGTYQHDNVFIEYEPSTMDVICKIEE